MAWRVEIGNVAEKDIEKLGADIASRVYKFLLRIQNLEDYHTPHKYYGKALLGDKAGYWSLRMGDYRLICEVSYDDKFIRVVTVGHRREVYD